MNLTTALVLLSMVIAGAAVLSRGLQRGYIDYLTPLLALYFLHSVTRGWFDHYWPDMVHVNWIVELAGDDGLIDALLLTAGSLVVLTLAYLSATRFRVRREPNPETFGAPRFDLAFWLLLVGLACRLGLRLNMEGLVRLPESMTTPIDTFGWSALAGVFLMAFRWGRLDRGTSARHLAAVVAVVGMGVVLLVDWRFAVSRENPLQLGLALLFGRAMGGGVSLRRAVLLSVVLSLPIFVWIGAMKTYQTYDMGEGRGYTEGVSVVRTERDLTWPEFVIGSIQSRLHGLDSLIVCRRTVPELWPYEQGSFWKQVFVSAFVPRFFYAKKAVGWGIRFATEFWGMGYESAGSASVGISQIGNLYVYGGVPGVLGGMAALGFGLGILAEVLRRRRDALGLMMFFLTVITICQVDRDLEVVLGGILKLLAIFAIALLVRRAHLGFGGAAALPARTETERSGVALT